MKLGVVHKKHFVSLICVSLISAVSFVFPGKDSPYFPPLVEHSFLDFPICRLSSSAAVG